MYVNVLWVWNAQNENNLRYMGKIDAHSADLVNFYGQFQGKFVIPNPWLNYEILLLGAWKWKLRIKTRMHGFFLDIYNSYANIYAWLLYVHACTTTPCEILYGLLLETCLYRPVHYYLNIITSSQVGGTNHIDNACSVRPCMTDYII